MAEIASTEKNNVQLPEGYHFAPPADSKFEVSEFKTASGEKFSIGLPTGSAAAKTKSEAEDASDLVGSHGAPFTVQCDPVWHAGSAGVCSDAFHARTGIIRWNIAIGGIWFKYRLNFECDQTYDYQFQDESEQWYECNVWQNGWHYIDYNSNSPNIKAVSGS